MSKLRMNEAWSLLMDKSIGSIAICGQGGIGKTHFMRQLHAKLLTSDHFQHAVWVSVSSNLTPETIQLQIAKTIGAFDAQFGKTSFDEKAQLISDLLSQRSFVLLLDDIWKPIDLTAVGVPDLRQKTPMKSKIVFTTRSKDVCDEMLADRTLKLDMLSVEDAWQLFRVKVGNDEILSHPKIHGIAREMVRRCMGWPILLCAIGRVMACKFEIYEWNDALEELKYRSMRGTGLELINNLLEFCFHALPNQRIKSCLLYFSLFPENFDVFKYGLIDFWICEQLLDACDNEDATLDLGYNAIDAIIGAGLVEEENNHVKLLEMVRECALSVAIKSQRFRNGHLIEATDLDQLETIGRIALMRNFIQNLAEIPNKLLFFLLDFDPFVMVKGEISQFMDALTVLDLSNCGIVEIPRELSELISLQYLDLSHTWIEYMPIELKQLTKLKCLNLEYNDQLRVISKQLIRCLSSLQVLKMFRCGFAVEELEDNILSVRAMDIDPLLCLEHLKALSITITCVSALQKIFASRKLLSCTQSLSLEVFWDSKSLDISPLASMKSLLTLEISNLLDLKEFTSNFLLQERSFERLERITLVGCNNLRELTWVSLVRNLKVLSVQNCEEMQDIINIDRLGAILMGDEQHFEPFAKLELLNLESLPELKSIYHTALPFESLKRIEVYECFLLAELPLMCNSGKANELVIEGDDDWWNQLVWENDVTRAAFKTCYRPLIFI